MINLYSDKPSVKLSNKQLEAKAIFEKKLASGEYKFTFSKCLCGETKNTRIANVDRYGLPWPQVICNSCGMVRSLYFLDRLSAIDFYSSLYRTFYLGESVPTESFFVDQVKRGEILFDIFSQIVPNHNQFRLLEVGCGAGGILEVFQNNRIKVVGYDFDKNYIELGKKKGLELYLFDDFEKLNLKQFDVILLSHVLEHFDSPFAEIEKLSHWLKPEGYIVCEVPGLLSIHKTYREPQMYFQNAHTYNFSASHLETLFDRAGFNTLYVDEKIIGIFQKKIYPSKEVVQMKNHFFKNYIYLVFTSFLWNLGLNPYDIYSRIKTKVD